MHTTMKNFKLFAGIRCSHKKSFEEKRKKVWIKCMEKRKEEWKKENLLFIRCFEPASIHTQHIIIIIIWSSVVKRRSESHRTLLVVARVNSISTISSFFGSPLMCVYATSSRLTVTISFFLHEIFFCRFERIPTRLLELKYRRGSCEDEV